MKIPKTAKVIKDKAGAIKSIEMPVRVLRADIMQGVPDSKKTCAIARALTRQFREKNVMVSYAFATVDGYTTATFPYEVRHFITEFDKADAAERKHMKPFVFVAKLIPTV